MKTYLLIASAFVTSAFAGANPDNDMKRVLDELQSKGGKPIETLTADEARKQPTPADAVKSVMLKSKKEMKSDLASVTDIEIDGAAGKIPARVYTPKHKGSDQLPIVVYFHGGGFVIATNDVYDATPRALAEQTGAIFISPEYRKGPEHKFPAAHQDAYSAYRWVLKNGASLGGDPSRIAVAGESAGGNLALNVAIKARDSHWEMPKYELLVYPVAATNMDSESYTENADAKPLNKAMMGWFVKNYLSTPEEKNDPQINLVAANLKGLPPATIITAQIDPLRSEGKLLSEKMKEAGVKVDYKNYDGVTHEFFGMSSVVGDAKDAQKMAAKDLKKYLRL